MGGMRRWRWSEIGFPWRVGQTGLQTHQNIQKHIVSSFLFFFRGTGDSCWIIFFYLIYHAYTSCIQGWLAWLFMLNFFFLESAGNSLVEGKFFFWWTCLLFADLNILRCIEFF